MATMVIQTAFFFLLISTCVLATQERELKDQPYEIWASDQSNSAAGQSSLGVKGGFLWIWKSQDIEAQLQGGPEAKPVSCVPTKTEGPCDVLEVFPPSLRQKFQDGTLGSRLGKLDGFGRPHGMIRDPQGLYVSVNMFVPDGGYVGIIDTTTYEAISLFRVTKFSFAGGDPAGHRSVHMSFWSADGSALLVANLNGKAIERIDV